MTAPCFAAFAVASLADAERRLKQFGIEYHKFLVPGTNASQIFLYDPEGETPFHRSRYVAAIQDIWVHPPCWLAQGRDCLSGRKHVVAWAAMLVLLSFCATVCCVGNGVELGEHYDEIARSLLGK